ncbi:MAG: hypothetical protein QG614_608 [Patescibacteria group bacterium]|nr:hypothetical protein [Patescibacteria group bacterium]
MKEDKKTKNSDLFWGILILPIAILVFLYFTNKADTGNKTPDVNINFGKSDSIDLFAQIEQKVISTSTDFYDLNVKYPVEPKDSTNLIENTVVSLVNQKENEWKTGGEMYNSWVELNQRFKDRAGIKNDFSIDYATSFSQKLGVRSYVFDEYQFTGGAHGSTNPRTYNFNKNGYIELKDVVNLQNNNAALLAKLINSKLPTILGDGYNKNMADDGLGLNCIKEDNTFDSAKAGCENVSLTQNLKHFIVGDSGITFIMEQYQVAPYASGMPRITLTWAELKPYLNSSFDLPLE